MDNVVKKAKETMLVVESVGPENVISFTQRINGLLENGFDLFASQSIGLDTGGGVGGAGKVMMVMTLVRYDYIKLMDAPSDVPA